MILTIVSILAVLGVSISILLGWYIRSLIIVLNNTHTMTENISLSIGEYTTHLETVYKMETFFGDSILEGLLKHSKDLREELQDSSRSLGELFGKEGIADATIAEEETTDAPS